jgi:hypothetical protein
VGTRKTYQKMLGGVDIPRRESLLKRR